MRAATNLLRASFILMFTVLFSIIMVHGTFAEVEKTKTVNYKIEKMIGELQVCKDKELSVYFLCHPDWKIQVVDDAVLVVMHNKPDVTMIVTRIESDFKFLGQITRKALTEKDRYKPGFQMERVHIGDKQAIKVKAYSKLDKQKRILDYYVMHERQLYGILFSITPKDKAQEYKFLLNKIINNFGFISSKKKQ